ncbi:MAG: hypothetical protein KatS3mg043_0063 [Rhodothermaceae bacterium]|nr:MAG: hypothetical protein KatS3mg043_0063 [Rhodothermaceae bacterium]
MKNVLPDPRPPASMFRWMVGAVSLSLAGASMYLLSRHVRIPRPPRRATGTGSAAAPRTRDASGFRPGGRRRNGEADDVALFV